MSTRCQHPWFDKFGVSLAGSVSRSTPRPRARLARWLLAAVWLFAVAGGRPAGAADNDAADDASTAVARQLAAHLQAGEFGPALDLAAHARAADRDQWLDAIANAQYDAGMSSDALRTAAAIQDEQFRSAAFDQLTDRPLTAGGARGGAALADFDTLIELITSTIAPDTWEDLGGPGAIEEFPTGVLVDASGLMKKFEHEPGDSTLLRTRAAALAASGGRHDVRRESSLRKVSLARLERRLQVLDAMRQRPDATLASLAGMYRLKYIFVDTATNDVVLAGPAGDWRIDREGRPVSTTTGQPCLRLDDLVVVLRNALEDDGKFGCAITPTRERLASVQEFLTASAGRPLTPTNRGAWLAELRERLGLHRITVHGIDPRTRTARVLVEADYHMKLVGLGLEEGVLGVTSYLDALPAGGGSAPMDVLRWWFTLNYDHVQTSPARDAFALRGPAVQVLSENELLTARGERLHTGDTDDRNRAFAHSFTAHFDALAAKYPVYADLRNIFDLAMASEIVRSQTSMSRDGWSMAYLRECERPELVAGSAPQWVESVIRHRLIGRAQLVVGVSGGVTVSARQMLADKPPRHDETFQLPSARTSVAAEELPVDVWWWD